jgi:hypothetical protein
LVIPNIPVKTLEATAFQICRPLLGSS